MEEFSSTAAKAYDNAILNQLNPPRLARTNFYKIHILRASTVP
jgi:hypothetical protein